MKRILLLVPLIIMLALLWEDGGDVNAASSCPSPVPACTSTGTLSDFSGPFGCTFWGIQSNGMVGVDLASIDSDGNGNITVFNRTTNNNGSGSTFAPWFSAGMAGTYCLNSQPVGVTADTGFIFPPPGTAGGCPIAIILDRLQNEVRLLESLQNQSEVAVCYLQFVPTPAPTPT